MITSRITAAAESGSAEATKALEAETTIMIEGPFDLRAVLRPHLRGYGDPAMRLTATDAWRAIDTPDGPATLHLVIAGPGTIRGRAWGPGAGWAIEHTPALVGADDDPLTAIEAIRPAIEANRLLRDLVRRRPTLLRIGRTGRVWEAMLPAVLEQKVTGEEARRAWRYLVRRYGEPAPGPGGVAGLRVAPTPEVIASLPYFAFHPAGVEQRRAETIRRVAGAAPRLEGLIGTTPADAQQRMRDVPGIGPWTAAEVASRALGDPDAVSIGDFHLPHLVSWALAGERRGSDERMLELLGPFVPHRARIVRLLEGSGVAPARRGPRLAPRRIEAD
jgi:3-methyladenine DNA glycosylase/8-oxoguanine DNA glycosylase